MPGTGPPSYSGAQKIAALRLAQTLLETVMQLAGAVGSASHLVRGTLWLTGITVMADRLGRDAQSALEVLRAIEQEYASDGH